MNRPEQKAVTPNPSVRNDSPDASPSAGWEVTWRRTGGAGQGGQGVGFIAVDDSTGRQAFIKSLHRPRETEARKRFHREVAAYETLSHRGLPKLFEANREQWREHNVELYLVLEYIRGDTLGQWVGTHGPMSIEPAVAFADAVGDALEHCHAQDVLHRDLKPANVMLRDDDPADPVVVDFGLSFNTVTDVEDITWAGQEIGNRFLRLSEAWQNRTPISDVTQLAGLFFFALTGIEPRMLLDDEDNAPHRRAGACQRLRTAVPDHDVRIRTSLFLDKAFNTRSSKRFQSAAEFRAALGDILVARPDTGTMEELLAGVDDYIARQDTEGIAADITRLRLFANRARELAQAFEAKKLTSNCQAYTHEPGAVDLCIFPTVGATPPPYDQFRFELRGAHGVVLKVNEHEVWTGNGVEDPQLRKTIEMALLRTFKEHFAPREASAE